jgi:tRNA threonylcarbamoyladenosine biosynthesis protein TsaE
VNQTSLSILTPEAMLYLGRQWASVLVPGLTLYLQGPLGAGKTTWVRGLLQGLGYNQTVKSPTYTLVESYELSGFQLFHFDLYRFEDPREWLHLGVEDYFTPEAICVIEWPEQGGDRLPPPDFIFSINIARDNARECHVEAKTPTAEKCLQKFMDGG